MNRKTHTLKIYPTSLRNPASSTNYRNEQKTQFKLMFGRPYNAKTGDTV